MVKKVEVMEDKQRPQTRLIKPIENKRARRVTYVKRKDCIKKKTMELATLCDIDAWMLCFGPNGEVDTWPENPSEVKAAIDTYKEYGKDDGGGKKVRRSSGCGSDEKIKKVEEANEIGDGGAAKRSEKLRKGLLGWDDGWLNGLSAESLTELSRQLQSKLEVLATRIELLRMMMINNDQNNAATYWFNNTESIRSFGFGADNNVSISTPYQKTLQTIELPASELSYEYDHHHHPTGGSAVPVWALNCYGGDAMNCNGGGNDRVAIIKAFDEILEETNIDFVNNNNYVTFDDPVSSAAATPNWTGNCCYGDPGWAYDEITEETNLD